MKVNPCQLLRWRGFFFDATLASTYEFSSYVVLRQDNSNDNKIQTYRSLGINKKAFEGIVKIIQGSF